MSKSLDGVSIKKAKAQIRYTMHEISELEKCMNPTTGPLYFCKNYLKIQHPTRGTIPFQPYEYQERLLDAYHNHKDTIAMLPRQMGKALASTTPILTNKGFVRMEDLHKGDVIYGADGRETTITYITKKQFKRVCYKIEFSHGEEIMADEGHLWVWYEKSNGIKNTGTTVELIERFEKLKKKNIYIEPPSRIEFEEKPLPLHPYAFGLYITNKRGEVSSDGIRIGCNKRNFDELRNILYELGITTHEFEFASNYHTQFGSFKIDYDGEGFPLYDIPTEYFCNSVENRIALLQGLMDRNGFCSKRGELIFVTPARILAQKTVALLATLGIKSNLQEYKSEGVLEYEVRFHTIDFPVFKRKRENIQYLKKRVEQYGRYHIKNIVRVTSVSVRCLQVDNYDKMFLAGYSLVPTHNTTCATGYLLWYNMFVPDSQILVAAHKQEGANDIMIRYRFGYENLPDFLRAGTVSYNRNTIEYDNGSRIQATTTTESTGRGKSLSLIYCLDGDTEVKIRHKSTQVEETISLANLYGKLSGARVIV